MLSHNYSLGWPRTIHEITLSLTDTGRYAEYSAARAEAFPNNIPASSTVTVADLVFPGMLVEVEAIAILGSA